jgi:mono/diheme cytochrome c family protein
MRTASIAMILAAVMYATSLGIAAAQAPKGGSPEAAKLQNPVAKTPESIAAGRKVYQRFCIRCHGPEGKGDGGAAGAVPPSDLTDDSWDHGSSDGEIFTAIHDGTSPDMEGYAQRVSDTDTWNVVNYIRSLAAPK